MLARRGAACSGGGGVRGDGGHADGVARPRRGRPTGARFEAARGSAGVVAEAVGTEMAAAGLLAALSAMAVVLRSLNRMDRACVACCCVGLLLYEPIGDEPSCDECRALAPGAARVGAVGCHRETRGAILDRVRTGGALETVSTEFFFPEQALKNWAAC